MDSGVLTGHSGGVRAVGIAFIVAVSSASFALACCSSEADDIASPPTPTTVAGANWACISAFAAPGLSQGSSVERAREILRELADDESNSSAERRYFADLLTALEGKADADTVGHSLDDVPCELTEP